MKALNPYSVELEKNPFYEISGEPLYKNGNYSVYKYGKDWFVYLYKNIIITERTGFSKELVDRFVNNDEPKDYSVYNFRRALDALKKGKKFARELGFKIC